MITATKRPGGEARTDDTAASVRELAAFYGCRTQALARHFNFTLNS